MWQQDAYMHGLNEHLKFEAQLAGAKMGASGGAGGIRGGAGSNDRMPRLADNGTVPDDIPDIGMMVPVEKV